MLHLPIHLFFFVNPSFQSHKFTTPVQLNRQPNAACKVQTLLYSAQVFKKSVFKAQDQQALVQQQIINELQKLHAAVELPALTHNSALANSARQTKCFYFEASQVLFSNSTNNQLCFLLKMTFLRNKEQQNLLSLLLSKKKCYAL